MNKIPKWLLRERQALPLEQKIELSQAKIKEWYEHWDGMVYVAFSGGKDSTVLLHLVRGLYPEVPAVFSDTGLEYPELKEHVKSFNDVITIHPKLSFRQVIRRYGYPVVSKYVARFVWDLQNESDANKNVCNLRRTGYNRAGQYCPTMKLSDKWMFLVDAPFRVSNRCCDVMKKYPAYKYDRESGRVPFLGNMASESYFREKFYLGHGCHLYDSNHPSSWPIAFWTEQDVLGYVVRNDIVIPSVYGDIIEKDRTLELTGVDSTGCIFCCFGVHMEDEPNRFQQMKVTHPTLYAYCMDKLGIRDVLDYMDIPYD